MPPLTRITRDPRVMGGKPCIRDMVSRLEPSSASWPPVGRGKRFFGSIPTLKAEDIAEALSYAAWRAKKAEVALDSRDAAM
jgi:uncharacterized protein (DUF433 family)